MKKLFIIFILLFSLLPLSAQINSHMTFKNVPIDGDLLHFVKEMEGAGFTLKQIRINMAIMKGEFVNKPCDLYIFASSNSKTVWKVEVALRKENNWNSVKSNYLIYRNEFIRKYGEPSQSFSFFSEPYKEGDGYEFQALRLRKCNFADYWNRENGTVYIEINKNGEVSFNYEDEINTIIAFKEKQRLIQDDI